MVGIGSRVPVGGARADAYRAYGGMSGETLEGIDLLFDHAEMSLA
jgi:hypothetical protein